MGQFFRKGGVQIGELNALAREEFLARLEGIWEHSPWIVEAVVDQRPFASRQALLAAMWRVVTCADEARQLALLRAHPDLAGKLARAGELSAESSAEQSGAGLDRLSPAEFDEFSALNSAYTARFGFPFIICVRNHTKASILEEFRGRLENDRKAELSRALEEVRQIAALRLADRVRE